MEEGTIVKWHKKVGDLVHAGDVVFEIATDKATVEHTALDDGYVRKILIEEGKKAKVNDIVALLTAEANSPIDLPTPKVVAQPQQAVAPAKTPTTPIKPTDEKRVFASPLARKIAAERGLNLEEIKGSGPRGRITSEDLSQTTTPQSSIPSYTLPAETPRGLYEEIAFTPMRKAIADKLTYAKTHIPHFYLSMELNVTKLVQTRAELKALEAPFTINDFIIKACAQALFNHPTVCSSFDEQKQMVRLHKDVDIAVAVTVPNGLITPILKNANVKSLSALSKEIKELAARAKEGKLRPEEYTGGAFTISNLGMYGIDTFHAIINPPQCAILAIGAVTKKPVVVNDAIIAQDMMTMTLSCDHRVVDGVAAAEFMKTLGKLLENPLLICC